MEVSQTFSTCVPWSSGIPGYYKIVPVHISLLKVRDWSSPQVRGKMASFLVVTGYVSSLCFLTGGFAFPKLWDLLQPLGRERDKVLTKQMRVGTMLGFLHSGDFKWGSRRGKGRGWRQWCWPQSQSASVSLREKRGQCDVLTFQFYKYYGGIMFLCKKKKTKNNRVASE